MKLEEDVTTNGRMTPEDDVKTIGHATLRGTIAAMAMTGMRAFTVSAGLVKETPPEQIFRRKAKGLLGLVPRRRRRAAIELAHWAYGAGGGAAFGALPDSVRTRPWAGPVYGLVVWLGFEAGIAPVLGLPHAKDRRITDRIAFAVDHALYGFVLSETRRQTRE
jgi:hypothetical protein